MFFSFSSLLSLLAFLAVGVCALAGPIPEDATPHGHFEVCGPIIANDNTPGILSGAAFPTTLVNAKWDKAMRAVVPRLGTCATGGKFTEAITQTMHLRDGYKTRPGWSSSDFPSGITTVACYTLTVTVSASKVGSDGSIPLIEGIVFIAVSPGNGHILFAAEHRYENFIELSLSSARPSSSSIATRRSSSPPKPSSKGSKPPPHSTPRKPTRKPSASPPPKKKPTSVKTIIPPGATHLPHYSEKNTLVRKLAERIINSAPSGGGGTPVGPEVGYEAGIGSTTKEIWKGIENLLPDPKSHKVWPMNPAETSKLLAWFQGLSRVTNAAARAQGKVGAPVPPAVPPDAPPGIPGLDTTPGSVWRSEGAVADFAFEGPPGDSRYLRLRPGDKLTRVKYVRDGWLEGEGHPALKAKGWLPENCVSPSTTGEKGVPKDVSSGEDGL
ncbi:hypothetical protein M406DRAFT_331769 [Cryphonectria parasitica EP155]|uniref:SH3 domain-containing protein n=1 Tax=Cryphonectria parasitica (strain ATCC 38755 / EP155) TaxID=660469 RepID=A0A9P4XZ64_CRYP1|nr:uncharacterized protein M406DRAFT_331769 [Cryphonectria parasitica EP155]KAF3763230.1 hypothetical protein M406DRAFT_331769 [Cryphonectria parasitica EP155]